MIARRAASLLPLAPLLLLPACATRTAARTFSPASEEQKSEALAALVAVQQKAASLPASRLLYDAHMSPGKGPAVPGTLAVTYDGRDIARASLTGPFGSRVAQYDAGAVTGEDRQALVVEPGALRAVLAGSWPGEPSLVEGCDGDDCLLVWSARVQVSAVVDRRVQRVRSIILEGDRGRLEVRYEGEADPWPERLAAREERSGRSLKLKLVAKEASASGSPTPETPPP